MEKRFNTLRTIAIIYKFLGVLTLVGTLLVVLLIFFEGIASSATTNSLLDMLFSGIGGAFTIGLGILFYGGGLGITLYAFGEGVDLMIAFEENTRMTALALQKLANRPTQSQTPRPLHRSSNISKILTVYSTALKNNLRTTM